MTGYKFNGKPEPLKVFGWTGQRSEARDLPTAGGGRNHHGQTREIVAAKTQAEVLKITGMTRNTLHKVGGVTGNTEEIEVANNEPGVIFWQPLDSAPGSGWRRA
jgi:hypothetical protein